MKDNKMTILVNSCDAYEDCWLPFFQLFETYWPNCPYEIVLNTESKQFAYGSLDIKTFQLYKGKKSNVLYGKRLMDTLKRIDTPYVLLMMDDFFIRKPVDGMAIRRQLQDISQNSKIACFSYDVPYSNKEKPSKKYSGFVIRNHYAEYKLNLQAGIWNRKILLSLLKPHENPWQTEVKGSLRACASGYKYYSLLKPEYSPIDYGKTMELNWGIVRGKWAMEDVVPLFEKHHISVDYSQRGFLTDEDLKAFTIKESVFDNIKSVGILTVISYYAWVLIRKISNHNPYWENDYIVFMQKKFGGGEEEKD